jgi:hypothetical protein
MTNICKNLISWYLYVNFETFKCFFRLTSLTTYSDSYLILPNPTAFLNVVNFRPPIKETGYV